MAFNTTILAHCDAVWEGGNHPISLIDPEDDGYGDYYGRHEGVCASVIAGVNTPPVFNSTEHYFDFMALSVENGIVGDVDFAV